MVWEDARGRSVAVERQAKFGPDGSVVSLAQLDIKAPLETLHLDLLVTGWCARVWLERHFAARHTTWKTVKRVLDNSQLRKTAYL